MGNCMTLSGALSVLLPAMMGMAVLFSSLASAQDITAPAAFVGDAARGKIVYQKVGVCVNCHGWAGDGSAGRNPMARGVAANLRETKLDTEGLTEVIKCGIPGTQMPYYESAAYRDDRCYGLMMADFESGQQPMRGKTFRDMQLADLIAYLQTNMIGLGKPTFEECAMYYGASADKTCSYLKAD